MMSRRLLTISCLAVLGCVACGGANPAGPAPAPDRDAGSADAPDAVDTDVDADADEPDADPTCEVGAQRCVDSTQIETCAEDGTWTPSLCPSDQRCDEDAGACLAVICAAGDFLGCAGERAREVCNPTGTATFAAPCPAMGLCTDGACEEPLCEPGTTRCLDRDTFETCAEDGSDYGEPEACDRGQECDSNVCKDLCTLNEKISSYIGCEYWSLDLDNFDDAIDQNHAIVVSNPNPELTAEIIVTRGDGTPVAHDGPREIPPLELGVYLMPADSNISLVEISNFSFKVSSNIPVTAHQFNPLNNVDVFSNDGSLLLPTNTLGTEYVVMSWEQRPEPPLRGFFTVVNPNDEDTEVTIVVASPTAPGPLIPTMQAGESGTFNLGPGQVLNIETLRGGDDLTGSTISATLPVAAFGGHECGNVVVGVHRCDHIESQLIPVDTWGSEYIATKYAPRGNEPDVWRILSAKDGTSVRLNFRIPAPDEQVHIGNPVLGDDYTDFYLDRGQYAEFEASRPFAVTSSASISLGHYMVGSNWLSIPRVCDQGIDAGNPTGIGDPALSIAVPIAQYREDYIVLVPLDYEEDYLNITYREGTTISLDSQPLEPLVERPLDGTPWVVATVRVPDGPHTLHGDQPFGLEAYGYDCHVSYAYPGGLNLERDEE
jgi:hypothetical protein